MKNNMTHEEYIEYSKNRIMNSCKINENGCWIWQGYLCEPKKIYGLTSLAIDGPKKKILAHRAAYRLWNGMIPEGMLVLHNCDIPLCCNPQHLHLGTPQMNMDEMIERGRKKPAKGERNKHARLTDEIVINIRKLHENGMTQTELRKLFSLASSSMSMIINRKTWRHI